MQLSNKTNFNSKITLQVESTFINPKRTIRPLCGFYKYFCRKFKMWTSLTIREQQIYPRQFFPLNPLIQSHQELLKYATFGEFFENREGALSHHFTSSYFFSTPQSELNKFTHQSYDDMYPWEKNSKTPLRVLYHFWEFLFQHSNFNVSMYSL